MSLILLLFANIVGYTVFDYNGVIASGQSLSVGVQSGGVESVSQPFKNLKLGLGNKEQSWPIDPADSQLTLIPLVEPLRPIVVSGSSKMYFNFF
jgi:hypothetical protein